MADDPLLDTKQAARYLSVAEGHLTDLRYKGRGPKFVKLGRLVRYRRSELEAWIDSHGTMQSTSQDEPDPVPVRRLRLTRKAIERQRRLRFSDDIPTEVIKPPAAG